MDPKAHLEELSTAFKSMEAGPHVSGAARVRGMDFVRSAERLLFQDAMERALFDKLLFEAVETDLSGHPLSASSTMVVMDRGGLGDAARHAAGLFALLTSHAQKAKGALSLAHVSFNTPAGLGALVRNAVTKAASDYQIEAVVSAPACAVDNADKSAIGVAAELLDDVSFVISHAGSGSSGLVSHDHLFTPDPLLAKSHVVVLSFPDPEALVGELPRFSSLVDHGADLAAIRIGVQVFKEACAENLGDVHLTPATRKETSGALSRLVEAARRHPWFATVDFISRRPNKEAIGFVCPCRSLLCDPGFLPSVKAIKTVSVGACTTLVARGVDVKGTLS